MGFLDARPTLDRLFAQQTTCWKGRGFHPRQYEFPTFFDRTAIMALWPSQHYTSREAKNASIALRVSLRMVIRCGRRRLSPVPFARLSEGQAGASPLVHRSAETTVWRTLVHANPSACGRVQEGLCGESDHCSDGGTPIDGVGQADRGGMHTGRALMVVIGYTRTMAPIRFACISFFRTTCYYALFDLVVSP